MQVEGVGPEVRATGDEDVVDFAPLQTIYAIERKEIRRFLGTRHHL